ncbi:MAG: hypothetical protein K1X74_00315 [Pirellulales bacterium]|nr:hypothetical protein [Pirellulales bacterium]
MSIEFRCTSCNKLLRTGDDTAGRQVKCPVCGTALTIPQPANDLGNLPNEPNAGPPPPPPPGPGLGGENPYQSPMTGGVLPQRGGGGMGPPWERDGASVGSFIATVREMYTSTATLFGQMRRTGGYRGPLYFLIVAYLIAMLFSLVYGIAMNAVGFGLFGMGKFAGMPKMNGADVGMILGMLAGYVCMAIVIVPVFSVILSFLGSGVVHLMLSLLGGATQPFEATYRVFCYALGSAVMMSVIPICGQYLAIIPLLIFLSWGLMLVHQTPLWKAIAAPLLPFLICVGICCGFYAFMFAALAAGAGAGGGGVGVFDPAMGQ